MGSNPTPSAILKVFVFNRMAQLEEASASEFITGLPPVNYGLNTGQPLEMTGFAARLV